MKISFLIEATDEVGRVRSERIVARDRDAAADQVRARGWTLLALEPELATRRAGNSPLSEREVVGLLEHLQAITRAGLPLPDGLRAASREVESRNLRVALTDLAGHLDAGRGLDAALLAEADRFPAHLQALVRAGARSNRLAEVLAEMVQASNLGHDLRQRIGMVVAYPALVCLIVLGLTGVICHLSSQMIEGYGFENFGSSNPPNTGMNAVLALTQFIAAYDAWLILGLVLGAGLGWLIWRFAVGPVLRQRFYGALPLLGPLSRFVALAEFCHLAALLVDAETPLPEAIDLAGASVGDAALAEDCRLTVAAVGAGEPLSVALRNWTGLPAGLGQLLAWGESRQSLGPALRFAGDMFEARAESQATFARQVLSGCLLLLIVWMIGFAIASIFLPISLAIRSISVLAG